MAQIKTRRLRKQQLLAAAKASSPQPAQPTGPELGLTGLRYWGGRVDEEFLTELRWDKARKIYREMGDNDATVGALLNSIGLMLRQVPWRVESDLETDERADFIDSCRGDMSHSWEDLLSEIARGTLIYGWQFHEIVYKARVAGQSQFTDGRIGWKKLPVRAQDTLFRWDFDEHGGARAMLQQAPPTYQITRLPIEKGLLFRTETIKNNPEGRSILRNAYRPWYFKRNIENIEGIGIERDLCGLPIGYAPASWFGANAGAQETANLNDFKKIVTEIKNDEQACIALPSIFDDKGNRLCEVQLLATGGARQFDTLGVISRYSLSILQLMLADFIHLGHEKVGSFALASTKTNLFAVAMGVFLDALASVFNRFAIPRLLEINGMDLRDPPQLMHGRIESRDLGELADYLSKLSAAGMPLFPNPELEAQLLEFGDLPVPTPEERALRDAQLAADAQAQAAAQAATAPMPPGAPSTPKGEPSSP